ncbi:hypothetical protein TCAL_17111 [Tigriopus californicus]|uniref:Uncharacterized protein n=1 Tax=Tigriopus californicus TaxID=6832 RepID=A0A553P480_TIGCA|nr:hypothetical protein TCAL_17111 [Tigriopus californicus]
MTSVVGGPFRPPAGSTGSHAGGAVGGGGSGPASLHLGVTSPGGTQSGFSASSSHHFLGGAQGAAGVKPVPMKLFATWEVDRTPPNCIPRRLPPNCDLLKEMKETNSSPFQIHDCKNMHDPCCDGNDVSQE